VSLLCRRDIYAVVHDNWDNNNSLDLLTSAGRGANNRGVEHAASLILILLFSQHRLLWRFPGGVVTRICKGGGGVESMVAENEKENSYG